MSEIREYRGRTNKGKWVYGYLIKTPLTHEYTNEPLQVNEGAFFLSGKPRLCIAEENGCVYEVDPNTVGQETGEVAWGGELDEPIYYGDICMIDFYFDIGKIHEAHEAAVVWREAGWQFKMHDQDEEWYIPFKDINFSNVRVIGNIWEGQE